MRASESFVKYIEYRNAWNLKYVKEFEQKVTVKYPMKKFFINQFNNTIKIFNKMN